MEMMESNFKQKLTKKEFVITMEVSPPDEFDLKSFFPKFDFIKTKRIDALNVTDTARAQGRMSPLAISSLIQNEFHIETIMHIAVRHRNLLSLHSDLMGAHALGIKNISFRVEKNIPRCVAINLKPKSDDNSFNLLKILNQTYNHFDMGIYLTPLEDGEINLLDKIEIY
mgnify:CR=1 FL=1